MGTILLIRQGKDSRHSLVHAATLKRKYKQVVPVPGFNMLNQQLIMFRHMR